MGGKGEAGVARGRVAAVGGWRWGVGGSGGGGVGGCLRDGRGRGIYDASIHLIIKKLFRRIVHAFVDNLC